MLRGYREEISRVLSANLNAQQSEARPECLGDLEPKPTLVVAQKVDAALGAVLWRAVPAMRNLEPCYTKDSPLFGPGSWPRPGAIPPAAHPVALAAAKPVPPKGREKALWRIAQVPGSRSLSQ